MNKVNDIRSFQGSVTLITGGASGIGKALGEKLAALGSEIILADLQQQAAKEVAANIVRNGGNARGVALDVTDYDAFKNVVDRVFEQSGRLDYLFNNAGIVIGGLAEDYKPEDWKPVLDVNINGVVNGVQAAYVPMIQQGFGHIINTASLAGLLPAPVMVSYAATKHAVVGLSKALRIEAEPHGVRVSALCPGIIRTPILTGGKFGKFNEGLTEEIAAQLWEKLGPITPEEFVPNVIRRVAKNHAIIIEPFGWRIADAINRWFPSLGNYMVRGEFRRISAAMKKTSEKTRAAKSP
jgi:NAD(P)-dependent dehydrogenase (short-subunit alcohol dehydrogenase family)